MNLILTYAFDYNIVIAVPEKIQRRKGFKIITESRGIFANKPSITPK